jgi:muramidase (phage lysozyme)
MNYLVIEGYKDAAESFSQESGIAPFIDLQSIEDRMNIKTSIQNGHIEEAIDQVNDLDTDVGDLCCY